MAESTTLETLVLEINSSAKGENEGITNLINPLRSLAKAVGTVVPALREMNRELKKMEGLKIPNIGKALSATSTKKTTAAIKEAVDIPETKLAALEMKQGAVTEAMVKAAAKGNAMSTSTKKLQLFTIADKIAKEKEAERIREWQSQSTPIIRHFADSSNMIPDSELRKLHPEWYTSESQRASNALANASNGGQASWTADTQKAVAGYNQIINAQNKLASSSRQVTKAVRETKTAMREVGQAANESAPKVSRWAKLWSTVGRIFKTMLIRTAIRSLIKAFGESWNAAYEFSNNLGGSFANAVDAAKTLLYDMSTTIIQTVAPVFEALVPILKVVTDAITYMCQGIQYLLKLLGMTSDVTDASTQSINKYVSSAGKGGKATKNMLASWDQLNVIQSKGNSGSGGASYKPGSLSKLVNAETSAITQMLVGESLLAVGLILACTGHIGVGIGMMAIGGAAIAKTLIEDWGKLPKKIQDTISQIMVIAGSSMLAMGVILLCTGNIPLGIGMLVAGVANLGIAVGLNWDSIVDTVNGVMTDIGQWFVARWTDIKNAVTNAWNAVSKWWTENIATSISEKWESVKSFFQGLWGNAEDGTGIAGWASNTWKEVSKWWDTNVTANIEKEGVWGGVKGFFQGVWSDISTNASNAWTTVNEWMDSAIGTNIEKEWSKVTGIFKDVFGTSENPGTIAAIVNDAWNDVSEWWNTNVTEKVKENGAWGGVVGFFEGLFGSTEQPDSIVGKIHGAWQDISEWWTTNVTDRMEEEGVWGGIKGFFQGIFIGENGNGGILGFFNTMWKGISKFWGDNVTKPIEDAWLNIATWFNTNVTRPVSDFFTNMINRIIDGLNWLIDGLNSIGNISIPGVFEGTLFSIPRVEYIAFGANGLYDVPKGDLFVANEAGAELVGSMNGKTTVANQMQIIDGIQKGVTEANQSQNELLRQQNELLRAILQKESSVSPSAAWGAFAKRSIDMWDGMIGG